MDYIDKEDLLREVYNTGLRSFRSMNLIDDSLFYPIIDYWLMTLKIKTQIIKSQIVNIKNFKGELPEDFFKLKSIVRSDRYNFTYTNPSIQVDYEPVLCTERPCEAPLVNCDGSKYYLNQKFEKYTVHFDNITPLSVHKTSKGHCSDGFQNLSSDFVTIENGTINTEFREGVVFITYESIENDGMIPDYPKLKEALKTLCTYEAFKTMFMNGEQDVISRLQFIEPKAAIAENIIRSIAKEQGFKQVLQLKSDLNSRYNVLDKLTRYRQRYVDNKW